MQSSTPLLDRLRSSLPELEKGAAEGDVSGQLSSASLDLLHRSGLLVAPLPQEQGGVDLLAAGQARPLAHVLRLLGAADLSLARLYEGHVNAIALVERYGDPAQREDVAAAVRDGALSAVWGADGAQPLQAERDGDVLRLHGCKILASGAGMVARPLVTAATPEGPVLLLLELLAGERADTARWTPQGMRASATGTVRLDGMTVGRDSIVGQPGDFLRQPTLSGGAWRFCAVHLGAAERLVDLFRADLVARGRGEDPYQLQRIAHCAAAVGTAGFWVRAAAERVAEGRGSTQEIVAFVNLTRTVTERAALDVIETVHRGAGLASFLRPNPVERIARDLATYLRQPVPDRAMADAARVVLASPRPIGEWWDQA